MLACHARRPLAGAATSSDVNGALRACSMVKDFSWAVAACGYKASTTATSKPAKRGDSPMLPNLCGVRMIPILPIEPLCHGGLMDSLCRNQPRQFRITPCDLLAFDLLPACSR